MTTIYCVQDDEVGNGFIYFATKAEACDYARDLAFAKDHDVEVEANLVADLPRRELFTNLLNNEKWAEEGETVFVARPRKRRSDKAA